MIRLATALSAGLLLACLGCNGDGGAPPPVTPGPGVGPGVGPGPAPAAGGETVVHAEDDGRAIDVARGGMVTFQLANNGGTGFVWTAAPVDPNVLAQQGDRTHEVQSAVPGGATMDVYHFLAANPGSAVVEMDLKRPWGNAPPARVVHVTINVH